MRGTPSRLSRLVAALAFAFAAVLPAVAARAAVFNPTTFTLANGMQVVVVENHRAPVVMHQVWYKVGAADQPPGKTGLAHFLEHLMFKGTKTRGPGEFSRIVARNGGNENAFTSQDYTGYFQKVARDRLEIVMALEADRMRNLALRDDIVLPERDVVIEERRSRIENEPAALLSEQVTAVQYLVHPYRNPVTGWPNEVAALTTADALAFYRRYYAPNNAILIVVGDITADELKPLAEKYYGAIPPRDIPPRVRPAELPPTAAKRVVLRDGRVRQPSWSRSYLAPSRHAGATERSYALEVLSEILGGGATSRLYRALVVEQKVAASAGAWYDGVAYDLTRFGVYATPNRGKTTAEVEKAVDAELARLLADGVTDDEVARVKKRMLAEAVYARDSLYIAARVFGEALTAGLTVEDVEAWPERIRAVTAADVTAAARAVLTPERSVTGVLLPDKTS